MHGDKAPATAPTEGSRQHPKMPLESVNVEVIKGDFTVAFWVASDGAATDRLLSTVLALSAACVGPPYLARMLYTLAPRDSSKRPRTGYHAVI